MASLASAPPLGPLPSSSGPSSLHGSPIAAPKMPTAPSSTATTLPKDEVDDVASVAVASSSKTEDVAAVATVAAAAASTVVAAASSLSSKSAAECEAIADALAVAPAVKEVILSTERAASVESSPEVGIVEKLEEKDERKPEKGATGEEEEEAQAEEEEEENLDGLIGNDEEDEEKCCKLCNRKYDAPRILSCLHVFCTSCIANQIEGGASGPKADFDDDDDKMANFGADDKSLAPETEKLLNGLTRLRQRKKSAAADGDGGDSDIVVIVCPACQQETRLVSGKTVEALPLDHVMAAMVRVNATEGDEEPVCTSCKDQGKAEASCQDCASFLCSQCVTAHQFMRCFENHSVVALEDLCSGQGDGTSTRVQQLMHKTPLTCGEHPTEILKHFCHTCSIPICNECLIGSGNHRQPHHKSDRIQDIEVAQREELQLVLSEGRNKVAYCQKASTSLETRLGDLQLQRDQVKGQIEEAFHSYKALLEQRREALVSELEASHKRQELAIMELFHSVEKTIEKIEDGSKFAQRIVENGNAPAILSVKKLVVDQLLHLISTTPNPDLDVHLEFETNMAAFNDAVIKHFGHLNAPSTSIDAATAALAALDVSAGSSSLNSSIGMQSASRFPTGVASAGVANAASNVGGGFVGNSPPRPFGSAIVGRDNHAQGAAMGNDDLASMFLNTNNNNSAANANAQMAGSARFRTNAFEDAAAASSLLNAQNNNAPNNQFHSGATLGLGSRVGGAFVPYPNEVATTRGGAGAVNAVGNFKPPPSATPNISSGRGGAASLLDADISTLNQNQLAEYVQQMNEQMGGGLDVAGLSPGLLANLADGLAGTNILSNLDSLLSILSPENAVATTTIADVVTSATPQGLRRPSPLPGHHGAQQQPPPRVGGGASSASPSGAHHPSHGDSHRSASRNSHSPTISESGISVDGSSQSGGSAGSGNASIASRLGINNANFPGSSVSGAGAGAGGGGGGGGGGNDPVAAAQALFSKQGGGSMGGVSINGNGQICINGQVIPGVNINSLNPPALSQLLDTLPTMGAVAAATSSATAAAAAAAAAAPGNPMDSSHHPIGLNSRALSSVRDASDAQVLLNCGVSSSNNSSAPSMPASSANSGGGMNSSNNSGSIGSSSGVLSNIGYFDPSSTPRPSTPQMHSDFNEGMVSPNGSSGFGGGSDTGRSSANRQQQQQAAGGGGPGPSAGNTFAGGNHPPYPVRGPNSKCQAMQIRHKFGTLGPGKCQFNSPHGFCLGGEENIVVADTNNHRIQVFDKSGEFKFQFGIPGRDEGQLWYPRKVAVLRNTGKYVVCDRGNERSRMQIFTKNGHFIRKIAIRYIDIVAGLAITSTGNIVAVDSVSPTVFVIAESGELVRWFDCSDYMREPSDIAVSGKEFFVCDFKGHCVVVFSEEGQFLRRIGCENITNFPNGIDISDAGDVLVGDSHGNRFHVAVFQRDGSLLSEFECPYVKVSRCCGLKITSEGYVVTLAKNNHHVLVLNTLYIT